MAELERLIEVNKKHQEALRFNVSVPQSTLDALDEAAEAISRARRELDAAIKLIGLLAPRLTTLLDDDILRLAQRRQKVIDIRETVR